MATELTPGAWHERVSWADRLALRPGDTVDAVIGSGNTARCVVTSAPHQSRYGVWVIELGPGGHKYDLCRVVAICPANRKGG